MKRNIIEENTRRKMLLSGIGGMALGGALASYAGDDTPQAQPTQTVNHEQDNQDEDDKGSGIRTAAGLAGLATTAGLAYSAGRKNPIDPNKPSTPLSQKFANAYQKTSNRIDGIGKGIKNGIKAYSRAVDRADAKIGQSKKPSQPSQPGKPNFKMRGKPV